MAKKKLLYTITDSGAFNAVMQVTYPLAQLWRTCRLAAYRLRKLFFSKYLLLQIQSKAKDSSNNLHAFVGPRTRVEYDSSASIHIEEGANIDDDCVIKVFGGGKLVIKENAYIGPGSHIYVHNAVTIGKNVITGPDVFIIDHDHIKDEDGTLTFNHTAPNEAHHVVIGDNVWLGTKSVITKGSRVGDGAIVGASTVVTKEVPAGKVAVGASSRILG